jgi:hypothetical protein
VPDSDRRYTFHPLERRGVLLGLQAGQVVTLLAGLAAALLAVRTGPAVVGSVLAMAILATAGAGALWPLSGRPLAAWLVVSAGWIMRRHRGKPLAVEPLTGRRCAGTPPTDGRDGMAMTATARPATTVSIRRGRMVDIDRGPLPAGIDLLEVAGRAGQETLGVLRDRRSGMWAAVVPVQGRSFVLLDADEQVGRLESWRAVLGTLARPGSPLRRIQWTYRSAPERGGGLGAPDQRLVSSGPWTVRAGDSYRDLVADVGLVTQTHQAWMVLAVAGPRLRSQRDGPLEDLCREVRLLKGHLRNAELDAGPPLTRDGLDRLIGGAHRRERTGPDQARRGFLGPMATDEAWSTLRVDASWHATYWICEWPRVEVQPNFLTPLLLGAGRRRVSVVMSPVPAERAARQVRAARAADAADEELRSRAGFLPSVRRGREAEGVIRRESELADGHADYRFSGYITVTADDLDGLAAACAETEQAAQGAHLELRRLYGRQREAYTWTLPLARGLA